MTEHLTFEQLPQAVTTLTKEVSELKRLLIEQQEQSTTNTSDELLTIDEVAELLHLSKSTVYSKHSKGEIPGVCKVGKRLYFQRQVVIDWVKSGSKKTNAEIDAEAETFFPKKSEKTFLFIIKGLAMENNRNNPIRKQHDKYRVSKTQLETIFLYLKENVATASMVAEATNIPQKNITRYKRDLERKGHLWEIEKKYCQLTGFKAWYLTTDPNKAPRNSQLNLF